jgi:YVTN family beta-propeller protein
MIKFSQQSSRASHLYARLKRVNQIDPSTAGRNAWALRSMAPISARTWALSAALPAALGVVIAISGCGSNLRATVTPIVPTGPASQPASYAFVVSASTSSPTAQGYGTVIDYSGDTVMATAPIGPGPSTYALSGGGSQAWTLNEDGTVSNIPVTTNLQEKQITYSTLNTIPAVGTPTDPAGLDPVVALFGGSLGLYALDVNLNELDVLTGTPDAFKLDVPLDQTPVTAVSVSGATRVFAITQGIPYLTPFTFPGGGQTVDGGVACNVNPHGVGATGIADGIETATYTVSSHIPLGVCPVYAVGSPDTKRVFVLNRGSDTISVINSQNNTIDSCSPGVNQNGQPYTCHPTLPLSSTALTALCATTTVTPCPFIPTNGAAGLPAIAGPVYAEYITATQQLVVSNYDGNTINIIDVSLDEYGNDSATFGTTFTVAVGNNPASVTALADGSRAYVANQTDGTVSVVNLASHTIETTLAVTGNPRTVVSTQNSNYGKVYVVSPNTPTVTIIRTDQDIIDTTVLVQGNAVDVRTTSPNASGSNLNLSSRLPGAGQPCFLPPSAFTSSTPLSLANCEEQDASLLTSAAQTTAVSRKLRH